MAVVEWIKSRADTYLKLQTFDLSSASGVGVYIIWHAGNPARVVKVGQGDIVERLGCHRRDRSILAYAAKGTLYVTWAIVPASQLDGIERYLGDYLKPLIGDRFPIARAIPVNSPFAA